MPISHLVILLFLVFNELTYTPFHVYSKSQKNTGNKSYFQSHFLITNAPDTYF